MKIGDIYSARIFFKGAYQNNKFRPVLIINIVQENYIVVEITSKKPNIPPKYHDRFKEESENWKNYGLEKQSFIKCREIHNIESVEFSKYINTTTAEDFEYFLDKIIKHNS